MLDSYFNYTNVETLLSIFYFGKLSIETRYIHSPLLDSLDLTDSADLSESLFSIPLISATPRKET